MNQSAPASTEPPGGRRSRLPNSPALYAWLVVVGFACFVLWLGTPNFSASRSYSWLIHVLRFFDPEVKYDTVAWFHGLIRKSAHLVVYGLLGLLAFRASWYSFGNVLVRITATAIVVAVGVALIDEARQASYDTRTGSPFDVIIDGLGAIFSVGIAALTLRWRLTRRRESSTQ
jgi:VanZ family protein